MINSNRGADYYYDYVNQCVMSLCQTTVMGRGVKLGGSGGIVTIQDIATGIIVSGYGQTQEVI